MVADFDCPLIQTLDRFVNTLILFLDPENFGF